MPRQLKIVLGVLGVLIAVTIAVAVVGHVTRDRSGEERIEAFELIRKITGGDAYALEVSPNILFLEPCSLPMLRTWANDRDLRGLMQPVGLRYIACSGKGRIDIYTGQIEK